MTTWQEFEELLDVSVNEYGQTARQENQRKRESIRRAFLKMKAKADERDSLAALLVERSLEVTQLDILRLDLIERLADTQDKLAMANLKPQDSSKGASNG